MHVCYKDEISQLLGALLLRTGGNRYNAKTVD